MWMIFLSLIRIAGMMAGGVSLGMNKPEWATVGISLAILATLDYKDLS